MTITGEQPTADLSGRAAAITRAVRRVRIVGWALALGWTALLVSVVTFGERESSYDQLEAGLRAGEVSEVQLIGELMPDDALGFESIGVRWRDGLRLRTATFSHATNERMARDARRNGSAEPVIVGSVEGHLASLHPDVRLTQGSHRGSSFSALDYEAPGWVGLAYLVLLMGTLMLIAGPRPWRATRWAWAWLVLLVPLVGVPAYFLFGGPTGFFRRKDPRRIRLTGGWAFLLALLLGGASPS
jgi:hypothetical protein